MNGVYVPRPVLVNRRRFWTTLLAGRLLAGTALILLIGASHLAFTVENIEEYYSTMSQKGLRFTGPPPSLTQDGELVLKAVYAQDPDGNWLEFMELPE